MADEASAVGNTTPGVLDDHPAADDAVVSGPVGVVRHNIVEADTDANTDSDGAAVDATAAGDESDVTVVPDVPDAELVADDRVTDARATENSATENSAPEDSAPEERATAPDDDVAAEGSDLRDGTDPAGYDDAETTDTDAGLDDDADLDRETEDGDTETDAQADAADDSVGDPTGDSDADAVSAGAAAAAFSLGPVSLRLPGPQRIDRHRLRVLAAATGRLLVLSTRSANLPVPVAAILAAVWAAVIGLVCATVLTALSGVGDPEASLRSTIWLAAHHAPLSTDVGTVTLLPLGLMIIALLPLRRSGRFLTAQLDHRDDPVRSGVRQRLAVAGAVAVGSYATIAGIVAAADRTEPYVAVVPAVLWAVVMAATAGGWGVIRQLRGRLPRPPFVLAVAVTLAVPLGIAALLTLVCIAFGWGDISAAQQQVAQPGMEQVGISLLQLGYLPNLIVWAVAFLVGTGVNLGVDRGLSPFNSGDAVLPDLPILAALPADPPNWTAILPITVALGGALGAVVFARMLPERRLRRRITRAVAIAVTAGVFWWILMSLAGGSLGDGRLDQIGPAAGTAVVAALLTLAGTLMWALLPTLASDARPVAVDLRERVSTAATAAKDATNARIPTGKGD